MFLRPFKFNFAVCFVLTWCVTSRAQEERLEKWPEALPISVLRTPLHPAEETESKDPVWWSAMESYKVRFEDGFEFFPALGADAPRHLSLRWRTTAVEVDGQPLEGLAEAPGLARSAWCLAYEHGTWNEVYDLLAEGLEQRFVFETPFARRGDLIIRARIDTPLMLRPCEFAPRALSFLDELGREVLRYGEGVVIDAAGCSAAVETRCIGSYVELRVRSAWLAQAQFPITVDPLTSVGDVGSTDGIGGSLSSISIAHHDRPFVDDVLVAVTRAWTAADHDVFAVQCSTSFASPTLIYSNIEAAYSDTRISSAANSNAMRWVVATQRDSVAVASYSRVRLYVHDFAPAALNSGSILMTAVPAAESHSFPQLGGTHWDQSTPDVLLVFQSDAAMAGISTLHSEAMYAIIDCSALTLSHQGPCSATPVGLRYDRERPSVNPERRGGLDGWVIVWTELDRQVGSDDWDVRGMRTDASGMRAGETELVDLGGLADASQPKVAGMLGSYLVCFSRSGGLGQGPAALNARCFEWPLQQAQPTLGPLRSVGTMNSVLFAPQCSQVAFDLTTKSHWMIAATHRVLQAGLLWRTVAVMYRTGGTGATVSSDLLFDVAGQNALAPAVCLDAQGPEFPVVWGSNSAGALARGARWVKPNNTGVVVLGQGCGTGFGAQTSQPLAGNRNFGFDFLYGNPNVPVFMMISAASANLPLDSLNLTGCTLFVDIGSHFVASIAGTTTSGGSCQFALPLPDAPTFVGDFYVQFLHVQPSATPLGFALSRGVAVRVR